MKIEKMADSLFYKNSIYKKNNIEKLKLINYVKNKSIEYLYQKDSKDDLWNSRAIFFVKSFFDEVDVPKSLILKDIIEFTEKNKNSKLNDYLNDLPGIPTNRSNIDKNNLPDIVLNNHGYLAMQLTNILIIENFFIVKDFIDSININKFENSSFLFNYGNNKYKIFFDEYSIGIKDEKDCYIFKDQEFEIYKKQLIGQPVNFIKLYFH